jgi:hypothetical protein
MFWNADYNAAAALPTLFAVFLRDTQKVRTLHPLQRSQYVLHCGRHFTSLAVGCCSGRQPPHQQRAAARDISLGQRAQVCCCAGSVPSPCRVCVMLFCNHLLMRGGSAFSSPDIAAVGEVGAVSARRCL